jgi:subtilase family serine protease
MMKRGLVVLIFCLSAAFVFAQPIGTTPIAMPKVPAMRLLNHDYIDNNQKVITRLDGTDDDFFKATKNDSLNIAINDALHIMVDNLQAKIELNKNVDDNSKYKWLRGVNDMLTSFISGYKTRLIKGYLLLDIIKGYDEALELEWQNISIKSVVENTILK